ncbi:MAG: NADH-quinone oxidoreductase subunit M [Desulfuromonadales bacterium]|jgi:NADH-quinone oxidoreductase subunit M
MMTASALPQFPWLSVLIFLPLAGALICVLTRERADESRWLALATTVTVFGISLYLWFHAGDSSGAWLYYEDVDWISRFGIRYTLGLDGISLLMVLLTAFLQVIAVLISWPQDKHVPLFFALLMVLEAGLMGVFMALDMVLFYLFWEVMLIPMFFLIGVWGHERRRYAALKFFLYTLAGSLVMLIALIALYLIHGEQTGLYSFALSDLMRTDLSTTQEAWLFAGFLLAFAVKTPLVPFHTWLPDAHTSAPAAGSVDLAGLLLKTGVYGMIRVAFPLFPTVVQKSLPLLALVALIGIFHAAWGAYRQTDIKRLVAYSSISHLGLVILGLAAWDLTAWQGSILLMTTHGITTGGLFALVAMIRQRTGTRDLTELGGLWQCMPNLSAFFLLFALASLGLPGLANFTGEILVLIGTFQSHPIWAAIAMFGVVFAAAYMLKMVQGVLWGESKRTFDCEDLTLREWLVLVPMAVLVVWLGLYPLPLLKLLESPVLTVIGGMP